MIEAVFTFALITAVGELILLHNVPAGLRTWVLGNAGPRFMLHTLFAALNLWIHWGTMTGSMTAVTAFVVSTSVCKMAAVIYRVRQA